MYISDINFGTSKIDILRTGNIIGSATGFFFKNDGKKYLVTNRHVVIDEKTDHFPDSLRMFLHQDRNDLTKNWTVSLQLYHDDKFLWQQHADHDNNKCDVVLIPLNANTMQNEDFLRFNSSSITFFGSEIINTRDINPFADVVVVGYPLGFHDEVNNLPVYRKAMIGSCYGTKFKGLPCFLIDANLHPGTSGSPVVNSHHTLFKETAGKEGYALFGVHSAAYLIDQNPLGLNVVWYAHLLVEIAGQQSA